MIRIHKHDIEQRFYCGGGGAVAAITGGAFGDKAEPGKMARKQANKQKRAVEEAMKQTEAVFAGYTPAFYDTAARQYVTAQLPGLSNQYQQARNALQFQMAGRGLERSSAGTQLGDRLWREFSSAQLGLAGQGQDYARQLQQQVENYRNQVVGQIQASVNPSAAAGSFLNQAAAISPPNAVTPLTRGMGDFAQQYLMANLYKNNPSVVNKSPSEDIVYD